MKSNYIKYIFIIFIIIILIFAIFKIKQEEEEKQDQLEYANNQEEKNKELKLGIARFWHNKSNIKSKQKCTNNNKINIWTTNKSNNRL